MPRGSVSPPSSNPAAGTPPAASAAPSTASPALVESYRRLADVFHDVLSEQSLDALLERIADTMGDLIPHDDLAFYEADEDAGELRGVLARGDYADEVLADRPFRFGEGITGWAVEHREPVLANRADLDPRVRFVEGTPPEPESLVAVPLIARGKVKGALNIYRVGLREFTEEEFLLAVRFGDAAALALDNAQIRAGLELQAQTDSLTGLWNHRSFHERLRKELLRASSEQGSVALVMLDLDDFKKVNDIYGHAVGDLVLAEVAEQLRASVRGGDSVCRVGGEEFAIIVPGAKLELAQTLAERVLTLTESVSIEPAGPVGVSVGLAVGPEHGASPRELIACAELAMMTAKARGKGRIVAFGDGEGAAERPAIAGSERPQDLRSIAHLKMLHDVSGKLSRLSDVAGIGATIADELRPLIDYHNCRVFVRHGDELRPVAFRGELSAPADATMDVLAVRVGVGITGHVAASGEPFMTGDAATCGIGYRIPGTAQIDESLLAVPLRYGHQVVGVIVISKLGRDQFDADDQRLLEVLAGHASTALVNAQLFEAQRREAESAKSLLELARDLSSVTELDEVADRVVAGAGVILGSTQTSLWLPNGHAGQLSCTSSWAAPGEQQHFTAGRTAHGSDERFTLRTEPYAVTGSGTEQVAAWTRSAVMDAYAVAPIVVETGRGAIVVVAAEAAEIDERCLELLAGVASQTQLAINTALGFATLERTFISTVEALANALEAKDAYTSSHARWIMEMGVRVGAELGLDSVALKRLELAALFHDIGKIGVPAEILTKPGPLTDAERDVMESHPEVGERILGPIEQLAEVRPIVRACHERFDGLGYPDRLAGSAIPLEARIIFACDAFHAMTTNRPYRNALPLAEARRRLRDGAGSQFDPVVVDACLRLLQAPDAEAPQQVG
jgi:diguanylate cyclase (GGDEF)-like protein